MDQWRYLRACISCNQMSAGGAPDTLHTAASGDEDSGRSQHDDADEKRVLDQVLALYIDKKILDPFQTHMVPSPIAYEMRLRLTRTITLGHVIVRRLVFKQHYCLCFRRIVPRQPASSFIPESKSFTHRVETRTAPAFACQDTETQKSKGPRVNFRQSCTVLPRRRVPRLLSASGDRRIVEK